MNINIELLIQESSRAVEILLRKGIAPAQNNFVYATDLVDIGKRLHVALNSSGSGHLSSNIQRTDVYSFALKMDGVMREKEGHCKVPDTHIGAMAQIQAQMRKFEDLPPLTVGQTQRILIHVANWAMIAEKMIIQNKLRHGQL